MKSELETKFYESIKKITDEFYMTLYCMTPSEDAYQDLNKLYLYTRNVLVVGINDETFESVSTQVHDCSKPLIEKFATLFDFMEDFYEENKDNSVTLITNIGRWNRSIWMDMCTRFNIMTEFMKFRLKASGKDIE